jgi:hypothetical protein
MCVCTYVNQSSEERSKQMVERPMVELSVTSQQSELKSELKVCGPFLGSHIIVIMPKCANMRIH